MKINQIGIWTLRIVLALGAIVAGCIGKEEVAGTCVVVIIVSFLLYEPEDF